MTATMKSEGVDRRVTGQSVRYVTRDGGRSWEPLDGMLDFGDDAFNPSDASDRPLDHINRDAHAVAGLNVPDPRLIHPHHDLPRTTGLDPQKRDTGCRQIAGIREALFD